VCVWGCTGPEGVDVAIQLCYFHSRLLASTLAAWRGSLVFFFFLPEVAIVEGEISSIETWLRDSHTALNAYQQLVEGSNAGVRLRTAVVAVAAAAACLVLQWPAS
jgi:ABC-type spermidine/putrescine transport system permease subunit I